MDTYFPKTRRPINTLAGSLKRPPPSPPPAPSTPKNARLTRPLVPPPVVAKPKRTKRSLKPRELFKSYHPHEDIDQDKDINKNHIEDEHSSDQAKCEPLGLQRLKLPEPPEETEDEKDEITPSPTKERKELQSPRKHHQIDDRLSPTLPPSPTKVAKGPLKGVSTSLLDVIRAKEAAAKQVAPEVVRRRELLSIAPELSRIVFTIFTVNKKEVMLHKTVIEKCFKGLKSNYTSASIIECLDLMEKVAPDWSSCVEISRGKFMRLNKDKYTLAQLLEAIQRYKKENC